MTKCSLALCQALVPVKTMDTGIVGRGNLFLSLLSALWAYVRSEVVKQSELLCGDLSSDTDSGSSLPCLC